MNVGHTKSDSILGCDFRIKNNKSIARDSMRVADSIPDSKRHWFIIVLSSCCVVRAALCTINTRCNCLQFLSFKSQNLMCWSYRRGWLALGCQFMCNVEQRVSYDYELCEPRARSKQTHSRHICMFRHRIGWRWTWACTSRSVAATCVNDSHQFSIVEMQSLNNDEYFNTFWLVQSMREHISDERIDNLLGVHLSTAVGGGHSNRSYEFWWQCLSSNWTKYRHIHQFCLVSNSNVHFECLLLLVEHPPSSRTF